MLTGITPYIRLAITGLWRRIIGFALLLRSKTFWVIVAGVSTFPGVFTNLYRFIRTANPQFILDSFLSAAQTVGSTLARIPLGLDLLAGRASVETVQTGVVVSQLPGFVVDFLNIDQLLGVYLVVSAVLIPYIFFRFWRRTILFLSSTSPAIEHYLLLGLLYVALVLVYSFQHGLGTGYLFGVVDSVTRFLDGVVAGPPDVGVNGSVNASVNGTG